jgi:membrane protease YdiL (CAAX protease family)
MSGELPAPTPSPAPQLRLPGPRGVYWALTAVALAMPFAGLVLTGLSTGDDVASEVAFYVRLRTLERRVEAGVEPEPRAEAGLARRPIDDVEPAPTSAGGGADGPLMATGTGDDPPDDRSEVLRQVQRTSRAADRAALEALYGRALAASAARPHDPAAPAEVILAHLVAVEDDELARKLAPRWTTRSDDLKAALAAVPDISEPIVPLGDAAEHAANRAFGRAWSSYQARRIAARLHTAVGRMDRARPLNTALLDEDSEVRASFFTLLYFVTLAGLFGASSWLWLWLRAHAGEEPPGSVRAVLAPRFPGLPSGGGYIPDPLVAPLGLGAWIAGYQLAGLAMLPLAGAHAPWGLMALFQSAVGVVIAWAVVTAFGRVQPAVTEVALLSLDGVSPWRASVAGLWSYAALLPLMLVVFAISNVLFGGNGQAHPLAHEMLAGGDALQRWSAVFAVTVAAPIGEELVFRGFLYRILRPRLGIARAILVTALLFAVLHMSVSGLLVYIVLGVAFALVYEWTGSLWASVFLHGIWNGVVMMFVLAVARS